MNKLNNEDQKIWDNFTKTMSELKNSKYKSIPYIPSREIIENIIKPYINTTNKKPYTTILDLHGMTKNESFHQLEIRLIVFKTQGHKCILVITGKGHGKDNHPGILKRKVPMWLETVKFKNIVRGWSQAKKEDGGDGAIYVHLK